MATDRGFLEAWAILEGAYGAQDDTRANTYRLIFSKVDDAALLVACADTVAHMQSRELKTGFPTPGDVLARIPGSLTPAMSAESAWTRVLDAIENGRWTKTDSANNIQSMPTGEGLDDLTLQSAGGIRGLYRIADMIEFHPSRLSFERRDFLDRYRQLTGLDHAGYLPDGRRATEIQAFGEAVFDDHLLTEGDYPEDYDA
jgi:hypothetical protein